MARIHTPVLARKPRVEFEGALYHVIVRGNHRRDIFRDQSDRVAYLDRIEHYRERYRCIVYAYVLMVHLLIETGRVPLSRIMRGLQLRYTGYFNKRYNKVGSLFQAIKRSSVTETLMAFILSQRFLKSQSGHQLA